MKAKLIKRNDYFVLEDLEGNYIYSTDNAPFDTRGLSLKNCEAIERGYDLDKLIEDSFIENNVKNDALSLNEQIQRNGAFTVGYKEAFQKAIELLGDKKFTKEDMIKAYQQGVNDGIDYEGLSESGGFNTLEELDAHSKQIELGFENSLEQTEWEVEVETETPGATYGHSGWHKKVKFDDNGCVILSDIKNDE